MVLVKKVKRNISSIYAHCMATRTDQNFGVKDCYNWHVNERGWSDVGYHYVIRLDGTIETGRPLGRVGAHAGKKFNSGSIGVCFEGGYNPDGTMWDGPTKEQFHGWFRLYWEILDVYHCVKVKGHYEVSEKTCPNFDVKILL